MVKNIKLKRKAKKLRNLRIVWYLVIDDQSSLLYYSYLTAKQIWVDMSDNVREHIVSIYEGTLEDILKSKIRLRKQIIKCKTK